MRASLRALVVVNAVAVAAVAVVAWIVLALPWSVRGAMGPGAVAAVAIAGGAVVAAGTALLLLRWVARPVDRLLAAASRLEAGPAASAGELPILGEPAGGGAALERAAVAFERLALALAGERERLAAKVDELTRSNRALAEARESLLRTEKLATVGRLAAGLAHEVGNPLGAVRGYVELARSRLPGTASPEVLDALARIDAAAQRIDRTIRDLLDFARPAAAMLLPVDVGRVLDAALRLARVQPRFKNVEVSVDLARDLPRVRADEHQLAQVFLNLLLNAGDATGGRGRVSVSGLLDGLQTVVVTVRDDGPGIDPADLPRIFDPFFTTKEPGQGTGLGLAISHRIVDSFGGEILARSEPGRGAAFELRFRAC
jgi:signal transduction histidine kinase